MKRADNSQRHKIWVTALVGAAMAGGAVDLIAATPDPGVPSITTTSHAQEQRVFPSVERAVEALIAATRANQTEVLLQILGPGGSKLVHSGDPVADREGRIRFVGAYDQAHRIEQSPDKAVLLVGMEDWPLPIPVVRAQGSWRFDTRAGEQEILDRRIGRNELNVIEVCRAYVQSQREYASLQRSTAANAEYAQRFTSRAGTHDGLYWPTQAGEKESPLGPLVAQARAAGYTREKGNERPRPYYGYYYRILTRQGSHAPGGAKDYIVDGHMRGGFALLAYPARYGDSGIMTFIVNGAGIVFEKNLGARTRVIAPAIDQYDPDPSWHPADVRPDLHGEAGHKMTP